MLHRLDGGVPPPEVAGELGEKGRGLYWLAANGFPIPPTWVLTSMAFDRVLSRTGLDRDAADMRWNLGGLWNDVAAAERVVGSLDGKRLQVVRGLRSAELPDDLAGVLEEVAVEDTLWCVRASPTAKLPYTNPLPVLSLLGVNPGKGLWDGIRQVWGSAFRREVLTYCALQEVELPAMAVVLHPMQPVTLEDRSGVVFSHTPGREPQGPLVRALFGARPPGSNGMGVAYRRVCGRWVGVRHLSRRPAEAWVSGREGMAYVPHPRSLPLVTDEVERVAELVESAASVRKGPVVAEFIWTEESDGPHLVQILPCEG